MEQDPLTKFYTQYMIPFLSFFKRKEVRRRISFTIAAAVIVVLIFYVGVIRAPLVFPEDSIVRVENGSSLSLVAEDFELRSIVRSAFWLRNAVILFGGEESVQAGDYFFYGKEGLFKIAYRLSRGIFNLEPIAVTILEGATTAEISAALGKQFSEFDEKKFQEVATGLEGYLFPDTYFFLPNLSMEDAIAAMQQNFFEKVTSLSPEITSFGKPLDDVVIMASILEKEARRLETKRIIAGILWKRLKIGMPLQVDATFRFINGKGTFDLTLKDLQHDSPYNTYRFKGLPPGAIANPGLDSILAAVTPIESNYLYYLADLKGITHYSSTFKEHKRKKKIYLP